MAVDTQNNLQTRSDTITNETTAGANTKTRVGSLFRDIVDTFFSLISGKADTSHSHTISDVTNLQTSLDGKAASSHSHVISDVTNLQTNLDAKIESESDPTVPSYVKAIPTPVGNTGLVLKSNGTNWTAQTDETAAGGIGSINEAGDVNIVSPTNNQLLKYNSATSDWENVDQSTLQLAKSQITDFAHSHPISDVTNLQSNLDGKEPAFTKNTGFNLNLGTTAGTVAEGNHNHDGTYAAASHSHAISDVTGLQTALDSKEEALHKATIEAAANAIALSFNGKTNAKIKSTTALSAGTAVTLTNTTNAEFLNWHFKAVGSINLTFEYGSGSNGIKVVCDDSRYTNSTGVFALSAAAGNGTIYEASLSNTGLVDANTNAIYQLKLSAGVDL